MVLQATEQELIEVTDQAFAQRLAGNDKFKAGDLRGALLDYHQVLLRLKGLDSSLQSVFGATSPAPVTPNPKGAEEQAQDKTPTEPTLPEKVKTAIGLTYLNSAAIHIKNEKLKRALECAQEALKIDPNNTKAKFREAQARIGLGEITKGKAALEDLQRKSPDVAIAHALKKLAFDEKVRTAEAKSSFRGMYTKKAPSVDKSKPTLPPGLPVPAAAAAAAATASASNDTPAEADPAEAFDKLEQEASGVQTPSIDTSTTDSTEAEPVTEMPQGEMPAQAVGQE